MRNIVKLLLICTLCVGLLAACGSADPAATTGATGGTTVPGETGGETTSAETTTQDVVNVVEDPLNNGEGDPLDAIDGTTSDEPFIDIETDGDADSGDTGSTTPSEGTSGGDSTDTAETTEGDDFVVDMGDLIPKP